MCASADISPDLVQRTCKELADEDRALVEPPTVYSDHDEGDIEDGEHWGEFEDSDIENDLPTLESDPKCNTPFNVPNENSDQTYQAFTLASLLSIMVAKWSYRHNVTSNALTSLLKLFRLFFSLLCTFSSIMVAILSFLPKSVHTLKSFLNLNENDFIRFVVCPSCHSLYHFKDCFEVVGRNKKPKTCSYVAFPNHRQQALRLPCASRLLAEITLKSGTIKYYPRKYYCYKSVAESLALLASRENFLKNCELWRLRKVPLSTLCDIYDGQIWKDFQYIDGVPFLSAPHNLALMLNIDWFRPYKHTPYSVGVIYMVVTNLPRSMRFRKENVILVGIVPGPSEPPLHMNSYLKPMVDELNDLWKNGIQVTSPDSAHPLTLRAALICVACDIPACRKVLGFCGHMSKAGCSKCTKVFGYDGRKIDFGGFSECPLRSEHDHREQAFLAKVQTNAAARDKIERQHGSRLTTLMELPYFDTVRCHVIDPMHNLYLGTSKYVMKQILDNVDSGLLVQERVDRCIVPSTLGRIPHKLASGYASLTADQWKTWTNVFSIYALHGLLDDSMLECWRFFVRGSRLLSTPMITIDDAEKGHKALLDFCTTFESLHGSEKITPNMHLHMHIFNCIKDYGPIYSFWLFSFERYNGMLGSYRTNQRSVELQIMHRFMSDLQIHDLAIPEGQYSITRQDLDFLLTGDGVGTLQDASSQHSADYLKIAQASGDPLANYPEEL